MISATNFKVCISFGFKKSMWASLAISLFSYAAWAQTYPVSDDNDREDLGVTYGLRFFEDDPKDQANQLWMKVRAILDCTSDSTI